MGSESAEKIVNVRSSRYRQFATLCLTVVTFYWAQIIFFGRPKETSNYVRTSNVTNPNASKTASNTSNFAVTAAAATPPKTPPSSNTSDLEGCTISFEYSDPKEEWTTKPLWFSSYPDSIPENTHKRVINSLTGLAAGGKSFYASNKKQRHCFGPTETATCNNIHPVVEMSKGKTPDDNASKFYSKFIFPIRNPATVLPAFHNGKAIKYHGAEGQISENDWRKHRDDYLEEAMEGWKKVLKTWKSMVYYRVGMYLPYEHLMDEEKGPGVVRRLGGVLKDAGFATAPDEDMDCIWYDAVGGREEIDKFRKMKYEYEDYVPGYTKEQIEWWAKEFSNLASEYSDDLELVSILEEYADDIQKNAVVDKKWIA